MKIITTVVQLMASAFSCLVTTLVILQMYGKIDVPMWLLILLVWSVLGTAFALLILIGLLKGLAD